MPHFPPQPVTVVPVPGESPKRAQSVAAQLMLPCRDQAGSADLLLVVGEVEAWLELEGVKVNVQFDSATMRHRRKGGHNELLGRAVGVKADRKPSIFDATGGMGRDAFVLADLGCAVTLCERVPVLLWLLQEALSLASVSRYEPVRAAAGRMHIRSGDSRWQTVATGSVIYLDPMFPGAKEGGSREKRGAHAAVADRCSRHGRYAVGMGLGTTGRAHCCKAAAASADAGRPDALTYAVR